MRRLSAPNFLIFCFILRRPGICTGGMVPFPAFSHQTGDTLDRNVEYHHRRDCFFFLSGASIGRNRRIMAGNVWKTSRWRNFTIFSRYIFQKTAKIMIANRACSCYNTECVRRRATFHIGMSPSGKAPDFDSGIRRFKSGHPSQYDPLAQSVEHRPFKAGVLGSSPRRVTKKWRYPMGISIS